MRGETVPAEEEKWRALIEHWPGFVLTVDEHDRLTSLNRNSYRLDAVRDLGRDLFDFVAGDDH
ncbi:MAG: PAS domain-containing protein, partial [Polyangiaceae bacterium]